MPHGCGAMWLVMQGGREQPNLRDPQRSLQVGHWQWRPHLSRFQCVFGRQAPGAVEWVHAAVRRRGAKRVFGGWRTGWQHGHTARHWSHTLLSFWRRDQRGGKQSRDGFFLQGPVHQVHGLTRSIWPKSYLYHKYCTYSISFESLIGLFS